MASDCELFSFVTCGVVIGTLCVFGLIGNAAAILVFKKHPTETDTIAILLVLAVADSLLLTATLFIYTAQSVYPYTHLLHGLHTFSRTIEAYVWPFAMITHTCTVYLTVMVTATRYVSVCKLTTSAGRHRLVHDVRVQVLLVIVCAVIYNIPRFFEHHPVMLPSGHNNEMKQYTTVIIDQSNLSNLNQSNHSNLNQSQHVNATVVVMEDEARVKTLGDVRLYQIIYSNIIYFPVMFIVPLLSLTYMNVRLIQTISEIKRKRETLTGHKARDDHITLCIIAIVCMFIVCQTPALVNQIFWAIATPDCGSFHYYYTKISDTLVVLNSSCNFMIYCLFGQSFRRIFLQTICARWYDYHQRAAAERCTVPLLQACDVCRRVTQKQATADVSHNNEPPSRDVGVTSCRCKKNSDCAAAAATNGVERREQVTSLTAAPVSFAPASAAASPSGKRAADGVAGQQVSALSPDERHAEHANLLSVVHNDYTLQPNNN